MYGRHGFKRKFTTPDIPRLNARAKGGLAMLQVSQLTARVRAASLFGDVKTPSSTDGLWAEATN